MASFAIHIAIGKRYFEKQLQFKGERHNCGELISGAIAPDFAEDKIVSHYSGLQIEHNLVNNLPNKCLLYEFLKKEEINNDYNLGIFLHLVTDYLFFNDFIDAEYIAKVDYRDFSRDLYYSYDILDKDLIKTFNLDYSDFEERLNANIIQNRKKNNLNKVIGNNILPRDKIIDFIEYVSDIDLEKYKDKILNQKGNVLP
ncbi:MAG: hypothetical protein ACI4PF_06925 [Christensenellales bacterium]